MNVKKSTVDAKENALTFGETFGLFTENDYLHN